MIVIYDKDDIIELNKITQFKKKKIFLFSPGLENYLKNKKLFEIYNYDINLNSLIQKKVIINSIKIDKEFNKNFKFLDNLNNGLRENIYNIFYVSTFSYIYLIETLKKYNKLSLIEKGRIVEFNNFQDFIIPFIEKINKKENQGFFDYIKPKKINRLVLVCIKLNNLLCKLYKGEKNLIVGSLLAKKIFKNSKKIHNIIEFKSQNDFKIKHLLSNLIFTLGIYQNKKKFFFFPDNYLNSENKDLKKNLETFIENINHPYITSFKKILIKSLYEYCNNQLEIENSIDNFLKSNYVKNIYVDQLRFGVATALANFANSKGINVTLVPHGSISIPSDKFSKFLLKISSRGLIRSKLANCVVSQSKISYDSIKYFDKNIKIIKSKPILFGKTKIKSDLNKRKYVFLHASTPKSLCKWPYIYENYNEYVFNIKSLIQEISKLENVELIIRFREGPECSIETFKKEINLKANKFVKISKNKDFFEDLKISNCLISFSSTSIEEALGLNKRILVYSNYKNYKHINFTLENGSIIYSNESNIQEILNKIIRENLILKNDIFWNDENFL